MSAIASELPGASVLDLFAGSGALGLEALSRGARAVTFVEQAPAALTTLKRNIASLGPPAGATTVVRADAFQYLAGLTRPDFDVAFADPPYDMGLAERLAAAYATEPFARVLCIEHSRDDAPDGPLVIWHRRYGDTLLTFLSAEA
jgi:16S rRNA (guanine966-N2)-methyltransferase